MRSSLRKAKLLSQRDEERGIRSLEEAMTMLAVHKGRATMRAVLCASLCNCRHTLRADGDERLVEVALEHLRRNHPAAPLVEERVRRIVSTRAYDIEYATP
jgi:predicted small metal-binding protein